MTRLSVRLDRLVQLAEAQQSRRADQLHLLTDQQIRAIVVLWRNGWWPIDRDDWRGRDDPDGFEAACAAALVEAETLVSENVPHDPVAQAENHRRYERWQAIFRPFMTWLQEQREYYERIAAQGPSRC